AEWRQMYDETGRLMRDNFWRPDMGVREQPPPGRTMRTGPRRAGRPRTGRRAREYPWPL
ncbi:hypothetical protein AB0887_35840, partial [Streptomyces huasconensis]